MLGGWPKSQTHCRCSVASHQDKTPTLHHQHEHLSRKVASRLRIKQAAPYQAALACASEAKEPAGVITCMFVFINKNKRHSLNNLKKLSFSAEIMEINLQSRLPEHLM